MACSPLVTPNVVEEEGAPQSLLYPWQSAPAADATCRKSLNCSSAAMLRLTNADSTHPDSPAQAAVHDWPGGANIQAASFTLQGVTDGVCVGVTDADDVNVGV